MLSQSSPADLAAAVVARITVVRSAAEPAREHAQWLKSGHLVAFGSIEPDSSVVPTAPASLGDTPSDISDAIVRVLFGPPGQSSVDRRQRSKRASLTVRELSWEQAGHLFADVSGHNTPKREADRSLTLVGGVDQNFDLAAEPETSAVEPSRK